MKVLPKMGPIAVEGDKRFEIVNKIKKGISNG